MISTWVCFSDIGDEERLFGTQRGSHSRPREGDGYGPPAKSFLSSVYPWGRHAQFISIVLALGVAIHHGDSLEEPVEQLEQWQHWY